MSVDSLGPPPPPRWQPVPNQPEEALDPDGPAEPTSWRPVDLADALAGRDLPAPELLERSDGHRMLYRGRVHWFQGESEACKSWLALLAVAQILAAGGAVLWVDFEDDDRGVVARLLAMSVAPEAIAGRFTYIRPDEPLRSKVAGFTAAYSDLLDIIGRPYNLAVIDGVTEAVTVEGLSLLDNADIATWLRLLPKKIADATGAAVVCIDHLAKDREGQGRYAIGAQHKLAGVTGAAYKLEVRKRFRRSDGSESVEGVIAVSVTKDRPGWVRAHANDDQVGVFTLTSWPDGGVSAILAPADARPTPDLVLCRRILEHLAVYDGATGRNIEETLTGKAALIREALKWMAEEGRRWVRIDRVGRSHLHYLTAEGKEEFAI